MTGILLLLSLLSQTWSPSPTQKSSQPPRCQNPWCANETWRGGIFGGRGTKYKLQENVIYVPWTITAAPGSTLPKVPQISSEWKEMHKHFI